MGDIDSVLHKKKKIFKYFMLEKIPCTIRLIKNTTLIKNIRR